MSYYRTAEHRKLRAELIRRWKPWEKSTGPKSSAGKARSDRTPTKAQRGRCCERYVEHYVSRMVLWN